jgi:hypothetical protein
MRSTYKDDLYVLTKFTFLDVLNYTSGFYHQLGVAEAI